MPTIITRGAASANAFGFGASSSAFDGSKYLLIPYHVSPGNYPNRIAVYNVGTATRDYDLSTVTMSQHRITRVKDKIIVSDTNNYCYVYDIKTGVNVQTFYGNNGNTSYSGDICKVSDDTVIFVYKQSTNISVSIWQYNGATFSNIYNNSQSFWSDSTNGFGAPAAAAYVTLNNNTAQFSSYYGYIAVCGVDYYSGGSTGTKWGYISVSPTGSGFSAVTSGTSTNNFSRPGAASGTNNYIYIQYFDNSYATITNGVGPSISSGGYSTFPSGNWSPCGVANSTYPSTFVGINWDYTSTLSFIAGSNPSSSSTILTVSQSSSYPGAATQMFSNGTTNGMMMMYTNSGGTSYITPYTGAAVGSSTNVTSVVNSGYINYQSGVRRIYNY